MKTIRLAHLFELKYGLKSEASEDKRVIAVRQAVLDAYNHYVNIDSRSLMPAYNILPLLAEHGEKFSKQIIALMEDLVNEIDTIDLHDLFSKIQNVLAVISELQDGKKVELRNSINDMFVVRRESDRNRREMAKSKFENVVFKKLASILEKQAKTLNILLGKSDSILGGASEPAVKEPSKQDQNFFRMTPTAVAYHLDNQDVFNQVWTNPDFKRRITYLINSAKKRSGDNWFIDPSVAEETTSIMEAFKAMQTNQPLFDAPEEVAQQQMNALPAEEAWSKQMQQAKQQKQLEQEDPDYIRSEGMARLQSLMEKYK